MASPITIYTVPNCGLEIKFIGLSPKSILDTNSTQAFSRSRSHKACFEYQITNKTDDIPLFSEKRPLHSFTGFCSPINRVTLPKAVKRIVGVPEDAEFFAAIHPPSGLASEIDWRNYNRTVSKDIDKTLKRKNKWAIPLISMLGGFVYFDKAFNVRSINALSFLKTEYDFLLSGPFKPSDAAQTEIQHSKRVQPLILADFFEIGFTALAWIRPDEKFQHQAMTEHSYGHGGIMFMGDDGEAVVYVIDPSGQVDSSGDVSSLADVFQLSKAKSGNSQHIDFIKNYKFTSQTVRIHRREAIKNIKSSRQKYDFLHHMEDKATLIHEACKAGCETAVIESLLDEEELSNLGHGDDFGLTPLHYACQNQPNNLSLISMLLDKLPHAISIADQFGRYPIHIACGSHSSTEVIALLLEADSSNELIKCPTKLLGRLPLHIAICKNGQNLKEIVELLLKADPGGITLMTNTNAGRLPLHMAVEKKVTTDVIKLLLNHNAKERYESTNHTHTAIEMSLSQMDASNSRRAIVTPFQGMLPLHIACWNNSSHEIIKLLLDADIENTTIDEKVGNSSWLLKDRDYLNDDEEMRSKIIDKSFSDDVSLISQGKLGIHRCNEKTKGKRSPEEYKCILPLHLATSHGSREVMYLLLEKEKSLKRPDDAMDNIEFQDRVNNLEFQDRVDNIEFQDRNGLTPLHIACRDTNDPLIVESLLEMDDDGITTHLTDDLGYKPIHYACDKENASAEIVKSLINAENRYMSRPNIKERMKWSTHQCEDRKRSPLYLAGKAGANERVIEILLQPNHFYLKGFDDVLIASLSTMAVTNHAIQDCIIEKLSERCYFNLLFTDIYTNTCALIVYLIGTEKLLSGEMDIRYPTLLYLCVGVFTVRTLVQIKSQSIQFLAHMWNYCQVSSIVLLFLSANYMVEEIGNSAPEPKKRLLIVTGAFLIAQLTFFLRATFLPFARFVGGLMMIFNTLIPFFVVSSLLLLAFAYGFRVQENEACPGIIDCYAWTLQGFFNGSDDTDDLLDILFGVIAIVVLLNVVIAIVSEAWGSAQNRAKGLFWTFRLEFLSEARFFSHIDKRFIQGGVIDRIGKRIDEFGNVRFVDHTPWSKAPYNIVSSKKHYDNPFDYFDPEKAAIIRDAQSLQASIYWVRMDSKRKDRNKAQKRSLYLLVGARWLISVTVYFSLCIGGLFTAGWLWPKSLRKQVLAVGLKSKHELSSTEEGATVLKR